MWISARVAAPTLAALFLTALPTPAGAQQDNQYRAMWPGVTVDLTVQRSDPSVVATCRVIAQATDFQPVAEQQVPVPVSSAELVDVTLELTTLRRATSASVSGCDVG